MKKCKYCDKEAITQRTMCVDCLKANQRQYYKDRKNNKSYKEMVNKSNKVNALTVKIARKLRKSDNRDAFIKLLLQLSVKLPQFATELNLVKNLITADKEE